MSDEFNIDPDVGAIVDTTARKADGGAKADGERASSVMTDDAGAQIDELRQRILQEQDARRRTEAALAAERHAREREAAASRLSSVEVALETIDGRSEKIKAEMRDAHERGDFDAVTKATAAAAQIEAQRLQLQQGREALRAQAQQAAQKPPPAAQVANTPEARLNRMPEGRSRDFLRNHMEYLGSDVLTRRLGLLHQDAVDSGLVEESDEYFSYIEREMDRRMRPANERNESSVPRSARAVPSAPSPRSAGQTQSRPINPRRVVLSRDEIEMAEAMDMTKEQYAAQKVAIANEPKDTGEYA